MSKRKFSNAKATKMIKRKSYLRETQYARRGKCSRQAKKMTTKKYPYTFKGLKDNEVIKYWIL